LTVALKISYMFKGLSSGTPKVCFFPHKKVQHSVRGTFLVQILYCYSYMTVKFNHQVHKEVNIIISFLSLTARKSTFYYQKHHKIHYSGHYNKGLLD